MADLVLSTGGTARLFGRGETVVVLGHGAGGNRHTPMLVALAAALERSGRAALRLQLPVLREAPAPSRPADGARGRRARGSRRRASGERRAARRSRRPVDGRADRLAGRRRRRARGRARVPRLPAPPAGPAREAPRGPPARDRGAACCSCRARATRSRGPTCWRRSSPASAPRAERHEVAAADHSFGVLKRSGRTPRGRRGRGPADRARLARSPRSSDRRSKETLLIAASLALLLAAAPAAPIGPGTRFDPRIPTLEQVVGHATGQAITRPDGIAAYLAALAAAAPDRARVVEYARSEEGRPLASPRDRQPGADRAARRGEEGPARARRPALALRGRGRPPPARAAGGRVAAARGPRQRDLVLRTPRSPWRTTCSRRRTTRRPTSRGARRSCSSTRSRTRTAARASSPRTRAARGDRARPRARSPRSTTSRGRAAARTTTSST